MIDHKLLKEINSKIEAKDMIRHILRGFDSPHVETTVGLLEVNSSSKRETAACEESDWLHNQLPKIERELKDRARALLEREVAEIDAWLSERVVG